MQFISRLKGTPAGKALPCEAERSYESSKLAEKLSAQVQWMKSRGIDISLKDSERPRPGHKKPPLPGTILYFSSHS